MILITLSEHCTSSEEYYQMQQLVLKEEFDKEFSHLSKLKADMEKNYKGRKASWSTIKRGEKKKKQNSALMSK